MQNSPPPRDFWDWFLIGLAVAAALGTPISIWTLRLMHRSGRSKITIDQITAHHVGGDKGHIRVQHRLMVGPVASSWQFDRLEAKITYGKHIVVTPQAQNVSLQPYGGALVQHIQWETTELNDIRQYPDLDFELWIRLYDGGKFHKKVRKVAIQDRH